MFQPAPARLPQDRCGLLASYGSPAATPAGCIEPPVVPAGEPAPYLPPVMKWYFRLARPVAGVGPGGVNRPAGDPTAPAPALATPPRPSWTAWSAFWGLVSTVSMGASAYHGYKRHDVREGHPLAWALWWGFCGALFPVITPVVAVAQGYGDRERD